MPQITGKEVGPIGYGLMGFTWRANTAPQEQAFEAMRESLKHGSNFWNGGEIYGVNPKERNSLHLLNEYFTKYPEDAEKIVLSIKGGCDLDNIHNLIGDREGIRKSIDNCLKVIDGKKKIDLFECARQDPKVPVEETVGYIAEYVKAGKIGGISLSEVSADTIRRAAKVHPIAAVEVEVSLWATEVFENGIADACAENNIPIVAYSPLGRGWLTGQIRKNEDIDKVNPNLRMFPRFHPDNFDENIKLLHQVEAIAEKKGVTSAQIAIAWLRSLSKTEGRPEIIPIPGATTAERVKENTKDVQLTEDESAELNDILKKFEVKGGRYPAGAPVDT